MEAEFLIDGPQPEQDLSYHFTEKSPDLNYIQKGIKVKNFRDNMNKRNLDCEFKALRRLTENQLFMNQFRPYNPEIVKLDRYNQVMPFKHTMVQLPMLTPDGGEAETYINANYIASSKKSETKAFIATQGPLEITRGHFWRMIWHSNVSLIIMLCRCKEDGKSQSDQYWKQELTVNNLKVVLEEETELGNNITKRIFKVQLIEEGADTETTEPQQKIVTHYQWSGWPDHGVPEGENISVMEKFVDIMYQERTNNPNAPVVIHCSAGIGRSGTLIAMYNLDIVLRENINDLDKVKLSVFGVVRRLREQRWGMVNTSDQYAFIYKFVANRIDKLLKQAEEAKLSLKAQE